MKRSFLGLVMLTATVSFGAEKAGFSRTLSPADFKAAGLDRLAPAERQRLDELIAARTQEAVAAAQRSAAEALAAEAEAKAGSRGFFAKARVMVVPGTQIEYAEIKATILGKFDGWEEHTIFRLSNGQRWQVANPNERYYTPPQDDTEVQIRPSGAGGFWMYVPSVKSRVRVKLLDGK